jgi:vacuolar-type H+-ATPase subunit D/Vma8
MVEATGRNSHLIAKALAYAIATIDGLPYEKQEVSDRDDMIALLIQLTPKDRDLAKLADGVEKHTGRRPNLIDHKILPKDA